MSSIQQLLNQVRVALKTEDNGDCYYSVLLQAQRDADLIDYAQDRLNLFLAGMDPPETPNLKYSPIDTNKVIELASNLRPATPRQLVAHFSVPSADYTRPHLAYHPTTTDLLPPAPPLSRTNEGIAALGTLGRVKSLLSVWGDHFNNKSTRTPIIEEDEEEVMEEEKVVKEEQTKQDGSSLAVQQLPAHKDVFMTLDSSVIDGSITSSSAELTANPNISIGSVFFDAEEDGKSSSKPSVVNQPTSQVLMIAQPTHFTPLKSSVPPTPLACQVTPVIPGRRSCVEVKKPKLMPLAPLKPEDNYDMSDKDTDSEDEPDAQEKRKLKKVPEWTRGWREKALAQATVDPESIFGIILPLCDLAVIFNEANYSKMRAERPKRLRGSSGNWKMDKLTQLEVDEYRNRCGQIVKAEGVFYEN